MQEPRERGGVQRACPNAHAHRRRSKIRSEKGDSKSARQYTTTQDAAAKVISKIEGSSKGYTVTVLGKTFLRVSASSTKNLLDLNDDDQRYVDEFAAKLEGAPMA